MKLALLAAVPIALFIALFVTAGSSCGAVTLEAQPPEEPLPEAAPRPRLLRREGGSSPAGSSDNPVE
jgi:hypothetical protein